MNYAQLKKAYDDWLATSPDPSTDAAFVAYMGEFVTVAVESLTGGDIFDATDPTDYASLSTGEKDLFHAIVGMPTVDITTDGNARTALASMFGAGTTTRTNLLALQSRQVPRSQTLGLGVVGQPHIDRLRLDGRIS